MKIIIFTSLVLLLTGASSKELHHETDSLYLSRDACVEKRVEDLMSKMTLEEKVGQLIQVLGFNHLKTSEEKFSADEIRNDDAHGRYPGFHSSDIENMIKEGKIGSVILSENIEETNHFQKLAISSRLKIPLLSTIDAIHGHAMYKQGATVFPSPITLAAGWDTGLVEEVASITAKEMRATGYHLTYSPNVEVALDPRWGRVGETFGEDPWLCGLYGAQMVKGYQGTNKNGYLCTWKVAACAKHLLAGSIPANGLNFSPADISVRRMKEVFLPPFEKCIDAGVMSIMAAHNEVNGIPSHANKQLHEEIIREKMGFDGVFISDWTDVERLYKLHKIAENFKGAVKIGLESDINIMMHGPEYFEIILSLVHRKIIHEDIIDAACNRILTMKFRLGLFEEVLVDPGNTLDLLVNETHREVALNAARQGIVLLKNENNALPLYDDGKTILLTGPNAHKQTILGDWAVEQPDSNIITILEGLEELTQKSEILHAPVENARHISAEEMARAFEMANKADIVIMAMGENSLRYQYEDKTCGENVARADLQLPGNQQTFLESMVALGKPVILVLVNGRPLAVNWAKENVNAIIEAWEPGMYGGKALAEIIYGITNPSGKLPISIPYSVGHIGTPYNHKPSATFRQYVFKKQNHLYEFGHGLSYTNFTYSNLRIPDSLSKSEKSIKLTVDLENSGYREGDEVILIYVNDVFSSVTTPIKELKAFKRVRLKPGEIKTISFDIPLDRLKLLNSDYKKVLEPGEFLFSVGNLSNIVKITQ